MGVEDIIHEKAVEANGGQTSPSRLADYSVYHRQQENRRRARRRERERLAREQQQTANREPRSDGGVQAGAQGIQVSVEPDDLLLWLTIGQTVLLGALVLGTIWR